MKEGESNFWEARPLPPRWRFVPPIYTRRKEDALAAAIVLIECGISDFIRLLVP